MQVQAIPGAATPLPLPTLDDVLSGVDGRCVELDGLMRWLHGAIVRVDGADGVRGVLIAWDNAPPEILVEQGGQSLTGAPALERLRSALPGGRVAIAPLDAATVDVLRIVLNGRTIHDQLDVRWLDLDEFCRGQAMRYPAVLIEVATTRGRAFAAYIAGAQTLSWTDADPRPAEGGVVGALLETAGGEGIVRVRISADMVRPGQSPTLEPDSVMSAASPPAPSDVAANQIDSDDTADGANGRRRTAITETVSGAAVPSAAPLPPLAPMGPLPPAAPPLPLGASVDAAAPEAPVPEMPALPTTPRPAAQPSSSPAVQPEFLAPPPAAPPRPATSTNGARSVSQPYPAAPLPVAVTGISAWDGGSPAVDPPAPVPPSAAADRPGPLDPALRDRIAAIAGDDAFLGAAAGRVVTLFDECIRDGRDTTAFCNAVAAMNVRAVRRDRIDSLAATLRVALGVDGEG